MTDNNTLLEKLDGLVSRFEEVSTLITDPSVIADQKRYVKLTKEYKELGDLMKVRKDYVQCLNTLDEAKQLLLTLCERTVKGVNIHNLQPVVQADRHRAVRFGKKLPFHVDMQDILRAIIAHILFYCGKAV